ncbi:DNA N6-methyl adenine demethylase isoform X2 [Photinus pyralis]|uniref:DNA N6-methyl adenine demethylase isoform X2 n=1 Tax=Photinus pyralis TaxID=7054 RepID=UPI0012676B9B|nr:DNA N6-methyl adenine demethylase isoform X2 [Photinus pyralis]
MSETLSQDPENLGSGYNLAQSYPPTSATPSSTVQDVPGSHLPPFSTFSGDLDGGAGFGSDRLFTDARLLDISSWDYYGETRLLDRSENGLSVISSQPQYRPWESKPIDSTSQESLRFTPSAPISTFADAFSQNGVPKLPSFQSQFQTFNEGTVVTSSEPTLTTLTNLTPVSPNSSPGGHLTPLNSSFHTLSAVNTRNYPLVPAPIQAREIPSIQQQFLDERHIQLYTHPTTSLTTLNNTIHSATIFPTQNGAILQNNQIITTPTVVTVLKSEPANVTDLKLGTLQESDLKIQNVALHHSQFQNPMSTVLDNNGMYNGLDKKLNGMNTTMDSPTRNDFRKKERRKLRASSLESSAESDGASSNMDMGSENSGQVASISSTAGFKSSHHVLTGGSGMEADEISGGNADKQVKKKRKRCGECIGCQRKDNCGDCAPCRNDKSHQICKQRRCEKLTEKKSYRGRKPSGSVTIPSSAPAPEPSVPPPSRPSPQPVHMLKPEQTTQQQQQPMTPMPFYADPNRFTTPVWQADPTQGWTQGQFIQQIAAPAQPALEGYPQQYSNGIYQTTFQQPAGFEANTFYAGAVQVLTRPPSAANQTQQLTPRPNGSYSHTPSPQPQQTNQRTNISGQYQQDYNTNNQNYVAPATTPTGTVDSSQSGVLSRPSSVNSTGNVSGNSQNFQTQHAGNFTPNSSSNFSPVSNTSTSFVNSNMSTSSGNAMPGYPPVSSHPQAASHNYSGGYPGNENSGQVNSIESPHNESNQHWSPSSDGNLWEQSVIQQTCNNQSAKSDQNGIQYAQNSVTPQNVIIIKTEPIDFMLQNDQKSNDEQITHQMQAAVEQQFSQADRVNLNSRLKTMILQKQQQQIEHKLEEAQKIEQNKTGHFLLYSHHRRPIILGGGGGVPKPSILTKLKQIRYTSPTITNSPIQQYIENEIKSKLKTPTKIVSPESTEFKAYQKPVQPNDHTILPKKIDNTPRTPNVYPKHFVDSEKQKPTVGLEIPPCNCLPPNHFVPEPGGYYTHLGCSDSLPSLRKDLEDRTGVQGSAIRIEKVCYTGKEGKTPQGCPIAKWIIRRASYEEKYLIIVKQRLGHCCFAAIIVVCIVAWDGVVRGDADTIYDMLRYKLNKFGLPTNRRCATNDPRTCACQGLDPDNCGASFSFGCSWSMYYNGCKYARSKVIRKFRLSVRSEEDEIEERMQNLATYLSPMYKNLAPDSFRNQCEFEDVASDCRLGLKPGRPFSGVTACLDFCAHSHKDSHNMNNGCTVVVTLTKHRDLSKPEDEQLHVLPLYVIDSTDEFGSREEQERKVVHGSIEVLHKYECEVRVRNIPQPTCRRSGKKRKEEALDKVKNSTPLKKENVTSANNTSVNCESPKLKTPTKQLQSNHVSSTVIDYGGYSPWGYESNLYYNPNNTNTNDHSSIHSSVTNDIYYQHNKFRNAEALRNFASRIDENVTMRSYKQPETALNLTYPPDSRKIYHETSPRSQQNTAIRRDHFPRDDPSQSHYSLSTYHPSSLPDHNYTNVNNYLHPSNQNVGFNISKTQILPSFKYIKKSTSLGDPFSNYNFSPENSTNSSHLYAQNPFDDSSDFYQNSYDYESYSSSCPSPSNWSSPQTPPNWSPFNWPSNELPKTKVLGQVTDIIDNSECFNDSQVGGVAIALTHGSVLFECAKHELHATTALKNPNRKSPARISLVFYQHRNMNKSKHGWDEHEEKMRLKKLDSLGANEKHVDEFPFILSNDLTSKFMRLSVPTMTTVSVTTVFPMYPCMVTGPYQEGVRG